MSSSSTSPSRRMSAHFVWDMMREDLNLLAYPFVRIGAGIVLLALMWTAIFDISAIEVGTALVDAGNEVLVSSEDGQSADAAATPEEQKAGDEMNAVFEHTDFGYLVLFLIINAFIGIFSIGAVNAHALSVARGQRKGFGYGYAIAAARLPQLIAWWILTVVVGTVLHMIERIRFVGPIIALLLGLGWAILTFFSITAIMATGCGPFGAIGRSKQTIVDCIQKARGPHSDADLKTMRIGLRVGGPLLIVSMLLGLAAMAMIFIDMRWLHQGGHGLTIGMFGTLIGVMIVNGAFRSAMYAVLKSVLYVWAEEDTVPENVDATILDNAFIEKRGPRLASI